MNASVIVVILVVVFLVLWCSSKKDEFEFPSGMSEKCEIAAISAYAYCMGACPEGDCEQKCRAEITRIVNSPASKGNWKSFLPPGTCQS